MVPPTSRTSRSERSAGRRPGGRRHRGVHRLQLAEHRDTDSHFGASRYRRRESLAFIADEQHEGAPVRGGIERAKRELTQSNRSLGQIARDVGFGEAMRMYEVFRRELGVTPSQYRKERKIGS